MVHKLNHLKRDIYGQVTEIPIPNGVLVEDVADPSIFMPCIQREKDVLRFSSKDKKFLSLLQPSAKNETEEFITFFQEALLDKEKRKKWVQLAKQDVLLPMIVAGKITNIVELTIPKKDLPDFFWSHKKIEKEGLFWTLCTLADQLDALSENLLDEFELTHKHWKNWSATERDQWKQFFSAIDLLETKMDGKELWTYLENMDDPKAKDLLSVYQRQKNMEEDLSDIKDPLDREISRIEEAKQALKKTIFRPKYQRPFDHNSIKSEIDNIAALHKKISEAKTPYDKLLRPHEICLLLRSYVFWADNEESSPQELKDFFSSLKLKETNWQQDSVLFKKEVNELIQRFHDSSKNAWKMFYYGEDSTIKKILPPSFLYPRIHSREDVIYFTQDEFSILRQINTPTLDTQQNATLIPFLEKTLLTPSLANKYEKFARLCDSEPFVAGDEILSWDSFKGTDMNNLFYRCIELAEIARLIEKYGGAAQLTKALGTEDLSLQEYCTLSYAMRFMKDLYPPKEKQTPFWKLAEKWKTGKYKSLSSYNIDLDSFVSDLPRYEYLLTEFENTHKPWQEWSVKERKQWKQLFSVIEILDKEKDITPYENSSIPQIEKLFNLYQRQKNIDNLSTVKSSLETKISLKEEAKRSLKKAVFRPKYQRDFDHNSIKSEIKNISVLHKKICEPKTPYDKLLKPNEIFLLIRSYVFWADNKETSPQELKDFMEKLTEMRLLTERNWQQNSQTFKRKMYQCTKAFNNMPREQLKDLSFSDYYLIRRTFSHSLLLPRLHPKKEVIHFTQDEFSTLEQLNTKKLDPQQNFELIPFLENNLLTPSLANKLEKFACLRDTEPFIVGNDILSWESIQNRLDNLHERCDRLSAVAQLIRKHGGISQLTNILGTDHLSLKEYITLSLAMDFLQDLCPPGEKMTPLWNLVEKWKKGNYQASTTIEKFNTTYSDLPNFEKIIQKMEKEQSIQTLTVKEIHNINKIQEIIEFFSQEKPDLMTDIPQMKQLQQFYQKIPPTVSKFIDEYYLMDPDSTLPKFLNTLQPNDTPFAHLEEKVKNIMTYAKDNKINQLPSSQKLTFFELLIIRQKFYEEAFFTANFKNSFKNFRELFLSYPTDTAAQVCVFSLDVQRREQETEGKKPTLLVRTQTLFEKYGHANVLAQEKKGTREFQVTGLGREFYHREVSERLLSIENFVVNTDALTDTRKNEFREKFQINWNKRVGTSYSNLRLADIGPTTYLRRYFGKKTKEPTSPKDISLSKYSKLACIEFAVIALIETTIDTYKEMGLTPPDSLKFFGFRHREDLTSLTITHAIKTLQKKKILVPYLPFEQILKSS